MSRHAASRRSGLVALAVAFLLALPQPATAQAADAVTLTGRVLDAESGRPIGGATVVATPDVGASVSTTTAPDGSFRLRLISGRDYEVSFSALGAAAEERQVRIENAPVDLGDIALAATPITLEGIEVGGSGVCDAPPEHRAEAFRLMEAVRPRLRQIAHNDHREDVEYAVEVVRAKVEWERQNYRFRPLADTTRVRIPMAWAAPDTEVLNTVGFAWVAGFRTSEYTAPTADWLSQEHLSERYCFASLREAGRKAIHFWPKVDPTDGTVEVDGTVSLDETGHPTRIDFHYVGLTEYVQQNDAHWKQAEWEDRRRRNAPGREHEVHWNDPEVDEEAHNGHLVFTEVSPGVWMTGSWSISGVRLGTRGRCELRFRGNPNDQICEETPYSLPTVNRSEGRLLAISPKER